MTHFDPFIAMEFYKRGKSSRNNLLPVKFEFRSEHFQLCF